MDQWLIEWYRKPLALLDLNLKLQKIVPTLFFKKQERFIDFINILYWHLQNIDECFLKGRRWIDYIFGPQVAEIPLFSIGEVDA